MRGNSAPNHSYRGPAFVVAVFAVTLAVFWPAVGFEFVDVDDASFVTDAPMVQRGLSREGIEWAFGEFHASNWVPVTFLSLMLDSSLYGSGPAGYHLTNILLHAFNAAILALLLIRLTGRHFLAVVVALLFALHPMRVESVAWVSERRDVLSTAFWLLTTVAWFEWVRTRRRRHYMFALVAFAVGLATKGMLVTLPLTLLIFDWWPLRRIERWSRLVVEKLPFFGLTLSVAAMTMIAQSRGNSVAALGTLGLADRLANASVGYATYLGRLLWPLKLAYFYPHPAFVPPYEGWSVTEILLSIVVLLAATGAALMFARRRMRFVLAGWLWYLVTLVPVIGLVQVGLQSSADRYTYVPHVGLIGIVVAGGMELVRRHRQMIHSIGMAAVVLICVSAGLTRRELPHWRNSEALFSRAIDVTRNNGMAMVALGSHFARQGRTDEARRLLQTVVREQPRYAEAHANLGIVLAGEGVVDEAIQHLSEALTVLPHHVRANVALGNIRAGQGRPSDAARHYRLALEYDDRRWEAYYGLGQISELRGNSDAARKRYLQALEFAPDEATRKRIQLRLN